MGAYGINDTVTSGNDSSISFGTSTISTKMVSMRINAARRSFCEHMNRIMRAVNGSPYGLPRTASEKIPEFVIPTCDLTKVAAFQEACMKLWESGNVSRKTLMDAFNLDANKEFEIKKSEHEAGYDEVFAKPGTNTQSNDSAQDADGDGTIGRPTLDDSERNSSPDNSDSGRLPKPSNPDGSEAQE